MTELSRWRAILRDGQWIVISEARDLCPEPNTFEEHPPAQKRADVLNRKEVYDRMGAKPPEEGR